MPTDDRKQFLLRIDPKVINDVQKMATHYGSNATATILRYIQLGLQYDKEAIRRERDAFRKKGDPGV
jgi:hypothetical protein